LKIFYFKTNVVYLSDKWHVMAKLLKPKKYTSPAKEPLKVQEPATAYIQAMRLPIVADFTFRKFQKIADKIPFTQKEWANILHLSERTLQRYAKDNSSFDGIYADRILQIQQLIEMGLETFVTADALYNWLKKDKNVMGHPLNFNSLYSLQGISETYNQIGRILHNVYT